MDFVVTGATGNVGAELVKALVARGDHVRGVVRSTDASMPAGTTAYVADLDRPETLREAMTGADGAVLLPGYADMSGLVALAGRCGVARLVQLSGASAGSRDLSNAVTAYMVRSEEAVRSGSVSWTIIRPFSFMSNVLRWAPQLAAGDTVRLPFASVASAMTHPADIAAVAAAALTQDGHAGAIYALSGRQSLLPEDQVRIVGEVLGRDLRFVAQTDAEARAEMSRQMPAAYVDAFFDFYAAGSLDESAVLPTVLEVTGNPPRSLADWAAEHRADFPAPPHPDSPLPSDVPDRRLAP